MHVEKVPKHIGIIMDGNRRFAKRLMAKPWKGHEWGAKIFQNVVEWCLELGIKEATFYTFSIQNFNRPKKEFDYIVNLFKEEARRLIKKDDNGNLDKKGVRINIIGRINLFDQELQDILDEVMERTKHNKKLIVNMALAYGGREEVIDATKKIGEAIKKGTLNVDDINEEVFDKNVYNSSMPDLIIRTGGERRLSNFLMWQSGYAELVFLDKLWPELEKEDLLTCVQDYSDRERRFGK